MLNIALFYLAFTKELTFLFYLQQTCSLAATTVHHAQVYMSYGAKTFVKINTYLWYLMQSDPHIK